MNQFSEEIQQELEKLAKKYNMTKGILLFEETDKDKPEEKRARAILFQPDVKGRFDVHAFAEFYEMCLKISKTFREVVNHMAMHLIDKVIENAVIEQELHREILERKFKPKEKKLPN